MAAFAQDDSKQELARPEWQMRADAEFRLACQSSLQILCLELLRSNPKDADEVANAKLIATAAELLETTAGKLPTTLPVHPSSIEYLKARKAAVIEWNKVYKSKGRDLPTVALNAEKKFQEAHLAFIAQTTSASVVTKPGKSGTDIAAQPLESSIEGTLPERSSDDLNHIPDKKLERRISETTVKLAVTLINETNKYLSFTPVGNTTVEKQAVSIAAKKAATSLIEKQPDFILTYPIIDVVGSEKTLTFKVDEPLEFELIRLG